MNGATIDYISQISIDGGQSWSPQSPNTLQVQPTQDGAKLAMIPILQNKKLLMIKLRDFPQGEAVFINGFSYSNSVKGANKPVINNGQIPNQMNPNNQIPNTMTNQPNQVKIPVKKPLKKKKG